MIWPLKGGKKDAELALMALDCTYLSHNLADRCSCCAVVLSLCLIYEPPALLLRERREVLRARLKSGQATG